LEEITNENWRVATGPVKALRGVFSATVLIENWILWCHTSLLEFFLCGNQTKMNKKTLSNTRIIQQILNHFDQ
jgi:hypothetical protein